MIYFTSDLHGDIEPLQKFCSTHRLNSSDTIVILGDAGINFFNDKRDARLKGLIQKLPCNIFVIRGNHDMRVSPLMKQQPEKWKISKLFDNMVYFEPEYFNIFYAMDIPAVYNFDNVKTLVIPGGYSIDKWTRIANNSIWFQDEQLSSDEIWRLKRLITLENHQFDMILSHVAPLSMMPTDLFIRGIDQSTIDRRMEAALNDYLINTCSYRVWMWGHYHKFRDYFPNEFPRFVMTNNDTFIELVNVFHEKELKPYFI